MIYEFPNFVDKDFIKEIKESCQNYLGVVNETTYNREGQSVNITATPELVDLDKKIHEQLMIKIAHEVKLRYRPHFLDTGDSGYEYHKYGIGDQCFYHADGEVVDGLLRYASVVIHLSTNDGELVFPTQNKKIKTEEGKMVVFPPYGGFGHYVTPSSTPREVLVSWLIYKGVQVNA